MKCEETYVLDIKDLVRWWGFLMFKLRHGNSILKFVLKTIQIFKKMYKTEKCHKEKSVFGRSKSTGLGCCEDNIKY